MIEKEIGVGRSTLSGWFKGLVLSRSVSQSLLARKQKHVLDIQNMAAAKCARIRQETDIRINNDLSTDFAGLRIDKTLKEIIFGVLYIGEGFKKAR